MAYLFAAFAVTFGLSFAAVPSTADARVVARVDISSQTMRVYVHGRLRHRWRVSTGARGHRTPTGSYSPKWFSRNHRSRKYNNAPMPYSIFFRGGYAVHGTYQTSRLGRPASKGCVRLSPGNARTLFNLVRRNRAGSRIVITH
ncbi:MAG: L,D-transpeptidase [Pseudomonadota bacterium]